MSDLHASAASRLHLAGQRYTRNRRLLVEALADADRPLTIPEILERCSRLPQSSAYRNLSVLEDAGLVARIVTHDEFARFELAEEVTDHHHHHLVCSGCGTIADFAMPQAAERALMRELTRVAGREGFDARDHRLDIVGLCRSCRPA